MPRGKDETATGGMDSLRTPTQLRRDPATAHSAAPDAASWSNKSSQQQEERLGRAPLGSALVPLPRCQLVPGIQTAQDIPCGYFHSLCFHFS